MRYPRRKISLALELAFMRNLLLCSLLSKKIFLLSPGLITNPEIFPNSKVGEMMLLLQKNSPSSSASSAS